MKFKVFLTAIIIFTLDLLTKSMVFSYLLYGKSKTIISNFFSLVPTKNTGAAFSIFSDANIFLIIVSVLILVYLLYLLNKQIKFNKLNIISYGLLIGGLLGNLYDRIIYKYVRDFFSFKIFNYDFAIFNVADIAICLGAILLIITLFKEGRKNEVNK